MDPDPVLIFGHATLLNMEGQLPDGAGAVTTETAIVNALAGGTAFGGFPLSTNHAKVLRVTRYKSFTDSVRSAPGQPVYTDVLLYMTAREEAPEGGSDHQFAFYVDTNGYGVVWNRDTSGVPTNIWTTLTNTPTLTTNAWHRLTIEQDFVNYRFQFRIDGRYERVRNPSTGGTWFNMVSTANNHLSAVEVSGGSSTVPLYLDDINVTNAPFNYWDTSVFIFR